MQCGLLDLTYTAVVYLSCLLRIIKSTWIMFVMPEKSVYKVLILLLNLQKILEHLLTAFVLLNVHLCTKC